MHENDRIGFLQSMTMSICQRISPKNMNFREFQLMKTQGRRGIRVRSVTVSVWQWMKMQRRSFQTPLWFSLVWRRSVLARASRSSGVFTSPLCRFHSQHMLWMIYSNSAQLKGIEAWVVFFGLIKLISGRKRGSRNFLIFFD